MEILKRIWNFRPDPQAMSSIKGRALRMMAGFLGLMLCCTVISRAADSLTVPVVQTDTPKRSTVVHTLMVEGILQAKGGIPVVCAAGAVVREVAVQESDTVEEGDLLFTYDISGIQREIAQKQLTVKSLQTEIAAQEQATQLEQERQGKTLERAKEDYKTIKELEDLKVERAGEQVRAAKEDLRKYEGVHRGDYDESDFTESEHNAMRSAYRANSIAYEQALADRDQALLKAQRDIDDAQNQKPDASLETKKLSLQQANLELSTLYEAVKTKGQVLAPVSGIVTGLAAEAGKLTTQEAAVFILQNQSMELAAPLTDAEKKRVEKDFPVTLSLAGENRKLEGLVVDSVAPSSKNAGGWQLTVGLPEGAGLPGMNASAEIKGKSQVYESCVPLSALYADGSQKYVLVAVETQTALGTEYTARRVDVQVQEQNETTAAVSGALSREDKVIVSTPKAVADGGRIRLENP
ncbi:hypothetical protein U6B65_06790 [Oscillospiraceae bacterium MB08-C2-2]|nr:hypothetical protein U6B65_06790 [Oscillospiraceae bacterium MB08-C2-2]